LGSRPTDQQDVGLQYLARLQRDRDAGVGLGGPGEADTGLEPDLAPTERALQRLRARFILVRDQPGQGLHDGDLGTEALPDAGELHADHAAAQDYRVSREEVQDEGLVAGDDPTADRQAGQRTRRGAGRQDHLPAGHPAPGDVHGVGRDQPTFALDVGDVLAGDQALQTLVQPGDHAVLVLVHPGDIDRVECGADAELLALPGRVGDLGRVQQGLGRDATAVQTGAAQLVPLDQGDGQTEFGGPQCRRVAAATTTENHDVVDLTIGGLRHRRSLAGRKTVARPGDCCDSSRGSGPRSPVRHLRTTFSRAHIGCSPWCA
jgi:hypothetical protein